MHRRIIIVTMAALLALACTGTALAYKVENGPTTNLDGKILMSPAAARVTTLREQGSSTPVGPGTIATRTVIVQNRTKDTVEFDLAVAEVIGSTGEDVVEVRTGSRGGSAAWATLERPTLKLKSGQTGKVNLTIRIPKAVKPGSKPFAVTATQRAPTGKQNTGGAGVQPIFRQVAIYIVELPGDAPIKGKITRAELTAVTDRNRTKERLLPIYPGKQLMRASLEYRNDGELLLNPTGALVVRNIWGKVVHRYKITGLTTYPKGSHALDIDLKKLPSFGLFRTSVSLESEAGKQTRKLGTFVIIPWWMIGVIGALLAYSLYQFLRWWLARRRAIRQFMDEDETYDTDEDADLDAEEFDDEFSQE